MAGSHPEFLAFLLAELKPVGSLTPHRFFGGWQLRSDGVQFAIVMGGTLFFRVEGQLQSELQEAGSRPFAYTKAGREIVVRKYMAAPEEALDDLDQLREWARRVIAAL